jgi:hypothetical protein
MCVWLDARQPDRFRDCAFDRCFLIVCPQHSHHESCCTIVTKPRIHHLSVLSCLSSIVADGNPEFTFFSVIKKYCEVELLRQSSAHTVRSIPHCGFDNLSAASRIGNKGWAPSWAPQAPRSCPSKCHGFGFHSTVSRFLSANADSSLCMQPGDLYAADRYCGGHA